MTPTAASDFPAAVLRYSDLVDEELLRIIREEEQIPNLHDAMIYSLGLDLEDRKSRGKRIRPVLCLATAEALGGDVRRALPFAAAIELMHNFALVHDDIEDGDTMRRGRPTTWRHFGTGQAINTGDYLLCKVLSVLLREGSLSTTERLALLETMSAALDHTHIGQCLDMNARGNRDFRVEDYLRIVREKTGYYLAAPMVGGAIVAGADGRTLDALRALGQVVGPLFQIVDDMIDLTHGKGRGAIGSDIREGKRSYMVAVVSASCSTAERERLYDILDAGRDANTDADIAWVVELFGRHGALEQGTRYCDSLRAGAEEIIAGTPPALRTTLSEALAMLTDRKH